MIDYPIILDTDPGLDDAIALLVLSKYAKDRLDTVITTYGNVSLDLTTTNLLRLCNLYGIAPYIIKGAAHPLDADTFADASDIHGADGLAGVDVPPADLPVTENDPIAALYSRIKALGTVDYISLGALTNLAQLITAYPDVVSHIRSVTTMGGGMQKGNITPYAEFNIYCDPKAAKIVCDAKLPQMFVPLNTTHQIALSTDDIYAICRNRSMKSGYLMQILLKNYETNTAQGDEGCIVHDATAVIAYLFPEHFTFVQRKVYIITDGEHAGETICTEGDCHTVTDTAGRTAIMQILADAAQ